MCYMLTEFILLPVTIGLLMIAEYMIELIINHEMKSISIIQSQFLYVIHLPKKEHYSRLSNLYFLTGNVVKLMSVTV